MTLHTGKRPASYDKRDLRYAEIRPRGFETLLPKIPTPRGGFGMDFADWLMLGNGPDDTVFPGFGGAGDCFWAGQAHSIMEAHKNASRPTPPFSGKTIIAQYATYIASTNNGQAYDPHTGANDLGTDVREGLTIHQKDGIRDDGGQAHVIGPYFSIEPGNFQHMWEMLWLTECLGIGIAPFPQSAMDQFDNNNQTWVYVPGSPAEGGHWIIIPGHPVQGIWTGVSWARRQTMTPGFLTKYNDEVWAWIDRERYNRITGETFEGIKGADVEKYIITAAKQVGRALGL